MADLTQAEVIAQTIKHYRREIDQANNRIKTHAENAKDALNTVLRNLQDGMVVYDFNGQQSLIELQHQIDRRKYAYEMLNALKYVQETS